MPKSSFDWEQGRSFNRLIRDNFGTRRVNPRVPGGRCVQEQKEGTMLQGERGGMYYITTREDGTSRRVYCSSHLGMRPLAPPRPEPQPEPQVPVMVPTRPDAKKMKVGDKWGGFVVSKKRRTGSKSKVQYWKRI